MNFFEVVDENNNVIKTFVQKHEAVWYAQYLITQNKYLKLNVRNYFSLEIKDALKKSDEILLGDEKVVLNENILKAIYGLNLDFSYSWAENFKNHSEAFVIYCILLVINNDPFVVSTKIEELVALANMNEEVVTKAVRKLVQWKLIYKQMHDDVSGYRILANNLKKQNELVFGINNPKEWNLVFTKGLNALYEYKMQNTVLEANEIKEG